jgi:glycosyltransferase involved in cell wall biosynthesis
LPVDPDAPEVTVVIPTIPPREKLLQRALASVEQQTMPVRVVLALDVEKRGAPYNRDIALSRVRTPYVAFLDDDDELLPEHCFNLLEALKLSDADLVYPWFTVGSGGTDPFPQWEGVPWDNDHPHQVPVTFLARTEAITAAGGFSYGWDPSQGEDPGMDQHGNRAGEDYRLILRLIRNGAVIRHFPHRTWVWHHHASNTSGLPSRW